MKIAISTLPFRTWTLEDVLECCRTAGYDALEVRMDFHSWSQSTLPDSCYQTMYSRIQEAGLCVSNLGSGIVLEGDRKEDLEELERLLEIAGILHTRGIRIMLGHIRLSRLTPKLPLDRPGIFKWLIKADHLAKQYDKEIWIETHNEFATGRSLAQIVGECPLSNTRMIWDIMHPLEQGETIEESLRFLGDHLAHVHVKDGLPWDTPDALIWKYTCLGEGIIPIPQIVGLLVKHGYDGYFSLEWESAWRRELEILDCDANQIRRFPGYMKNMIKHIK